MEHRVDKFCQFLFNIEIFSIFPIEISSISIQYWDFFNIYFANFVNFYSKLRFSQYSLCKLRQLPIQYWDFLNILYANFVDFCSKLRFSQYSLWKFCSLLCNIEIFSTFPNIVFLNILNILTIVAPWKFRFAPNCSWIHRS